MMVSVAYVGNKGTRLPSQISPINVLNPNLLGHYGNNLTKQFTAEGQTVAGVAEPYAGWYTQLNDEWLHSDASPRPCCRTRNTADR